MLRRNVRLRKEYLFKKSIEEKQHAIQDRKKRLRAALDSGKPIPTELRADDGLLSKIDLDDKRTENTTTTHIDDEYAFAGIKDAKVLITTSRHPSSRLTQFAKELKLVIPGSSRINRGAYVVKDLVNLGRTNDVTDIILLHEHRGEPDGLIICHLPHGPTAYFSLSGVVIRHDLENKPEKMSEAAPHLIFDKFSSKLGCRVQNILKYLFSPPSATSKRILAFCNSNDQIAFRHYVWTDETSSSFEDKEEQEENNIAKKNKKTQTTPHTTTTTEESEKKLGGNVINLKEIGPRFNMRLYRIELGTVDMKDVETEWALRSFINKQKASL